VWAFACIYIYVCLPAGKWPQLSDEQYTYMQAFMFFFCVFVRVCMGVIVLMNLYMHIGIYVPVHMYVLYHGRTCVHAELYVCA